MLSRNTGHYLIKHQSESIQHKYIRNNITDSGLFTFKTKFLDNTNNVVIINAKVA